MSIYPWQLKLWQQIQLRKSQLPHALLLQGRAGTGKYVFAQFLAKGLLCESPLENGMPCEKCSACGWFAQGSHPDFRLLEPEALSQTAETMVYIASIRIMLNRF